MKTKTKKTKKKSYKVKLFLAVFTTINLLLTLFMRIYDRKETIKVIEQDDKIKTLLVSKEVTKNL